jgi:hypothetical protein
MLAGRPVVIFSGSAPNGNPRDMHRIAIASDCYTMGRCRAHNPGQALAMATAARTRVNSEFARALLPDARLAA